MVEGERGEEDMVEGEHGGRGMRWEGDAVEGKHGRRGMWWGQGRGRRGTW